MHIQLATCAQRKKKKKLVISQGRPGRKNTHIDHKYKGYEKNTIRSGRLERKTQARMTDEHKRYRRNKTGVKCALRTRSTAANCIQQMQDKDKKSRPFNTKSIYIQRQEGWDSTQDGSRDVCIMSFYNASSRNCKMEEISAGWWSWKGWKGNIGKRRGSHLIKRPLKD